MRALASLLVLAAALGCETRGKQLYPGPARPDGEIAIVERAPGRGTVRLRSIDDLAANGSGFHVLPGEHRLEVTVRYLVTIHSGGMTESLWVEVPCSATFTAEAGRTYFVRGDTVEIGREAMGRSFVPALFVADRGAPEIGVGKYRCHD